MRIMNLSRDLTVSAQITAEDVKTLADNGVKNIICNRPDGESQDQPPIEEIKNAAIEHGIELIEMPFKSGEQTKEQVSQFLSILGSAANSQTKVHAYCRTGNRSACIWAAASVSAGDNAETVVATAKDIGVDVKEAIAPYLQRNEPAAENAAGASAKPYYDIVIVGAGSGGIASAASLLKRNNQLRIAVIDPAESHYYQPGWTMVGGGVFKDEATKRQTQDIVPRGVSWLKQSVESFHPDDNELQLDNQQRVVYQQLIVAPGLTLDWDGVKGLKESLGKNGVTSNYSYSHAPYTWELVKSLKKGRAIFTQPPMPIKCAGAPQKALYLSGDHWFKSGVLKDISIDFFNSGGALFGVAAYVPALQKYIDKYRAKTHYGHTLVEVDGDKKQAYFKAGDSDELLCEDFDMLHVCPPQKAPAFIASSVLADAGGWLDVDQYSLQHKKFENIWGVGDVLNTPNAKTMAAVRKQVPVVAANIVSAMAKQNLEAGYDGYGSCPLTVERGKIVLAEFGYGGKLLPSFPTFLLNGLNPTKRAWWLKKDLLPGIYWHAMLKGREWLAAPKKLNSLKSTS